MAYSQILRNVNFICEPSNVTIDVEFPPSSRSFILTLKMDNAVAMETSHKTSDFPTTQDDYNDCIVSFCDRFMSLEEDDLYSYANNYMRALSIYRNLKKVLSKTGKTVWEKS
jgi:hypothetical protein